MASQGQSGGARAYVDGQEPCVLGEASGAHVIDPSAIISSVGEVAYEWRLDTDAISWGANVGAVLPIHDPTAIATGRSFAQWVESSSGASRADAVQRSALSDDGTGVPYELQYALRLPGASGPAWVEDIGRWFAGADGSPLRAHGVLRVINARHEREQRLAYLSRFDALTGEMNRWHLTGFSRRASRKRSSCARHAASSSPRSTILATSTAPTVSTSPTK